MTEVPDRRAAIQLARQLVAGVPKAIPSTVHYLHVGRERWLEGIRADLADAYEADASVVRFVKGYYGDGKSHFLFMTMWTALQQGFVASYVSAERTRLRAFDLELVWKAMVQNLATRESDGEPEGLSGLLDRWCATTKNVPAALAGIDSLAKLDANFRQAIRGYLRAHFEETDKAPYQQWLQGDPIRPTGVRSRIDRTNCHVMLRSLAVLLKHLGYHGLMILMDELELIHEQPKRVRDAAYESLRQLVDNPFAVPSYIFIGAATPEMFTSPRGFQEYVALWQRAGLAFGLQREDEPVNYRGVVVDLERTPLSSEELVEIARRVRAIYGVAESWDAASGMPDDVLERLVSHIEGESADLSKPRWVVATVLDQLMKTRQDPSYDVLHRIPQDVRNAAERIQEAERRRHRQIDEEA